MQLSKFYRLNTDFTLFGARWTSMDNETIDQGRIVDILNRGLFQASEESKKLLPVIVAKPNATVFIFQTDAYLMLSIVSSVDKNRLTKLENSEISPFPCLIKPNFVSAPVAFVLDKSKNTLIANCSVEGIFSFSLGRDCTLILQNHKQYVKMKNDSVCNYIIDLAFLISFGEEIKSSNVYDFVRGLVEYYVVNSRPVSSR